MGRGASWGANLGSNKERVQRETFFHAFEKEIHSDKQVSRLLDIIRKAIGSEWGDTNLSQRKKGGRGELRCLNENISDAC